MKKAIVLAANYPYCDQVLTIVKSICYHNRDVIFYLINSDFPNEWFVSLNKKLVPLDCEIINARVDSRQIEQYKTDISYTVFLRYFIGDFVKEDKVLYLDCDMVVTQDLSDLFSIDLGEYPLAAVKDLGGHHYFNERIFNAGMLLINNVYWKQQGITQELIRLTNELHDKVPSADQSILNILFKDRWLELAYTYNAITLHTHFAAWDVLKPTYPAIIHYLTERKPWKEFTKSPYRDVWWFYHDLEWSEIQGIVPVLTQEALSFSYKMRALVYTYTDALEHIEYLIEQVPECQFVIAAPVVVSDNIGRLLRYPNVVVASDIAPIPDVMRYYIHTSQVLLDINFGDEVEGVVAAFQSQAKPVLAFETTQHGKAGGGQIIFSSDNPQALVDWMISYFTDEL